MSIWRSCAWEFWMVVFFNVPLHTRKQVHTWIYWNLFTWGVELKWTAIAMLQLNSWTNYSNNIKCYIDEHVCRFRSLSLMFDAHALCPWALVLRKPDVFHFVAPTALRVSTYIFTKEQHNMYIYRRFALSFLVLYIK